MNQKNCTDFAIIHCEPYTATKNRGPILSGTVKHLTGAYEQLKRPTLCTAKAWLHGCVAKQLALLSSMHFGFSKLAPCYGVPQLSRQKQRENAQGKN